jgi:hypothetical protein
MRWCALQLSISKDSVALLWHSMYTAAERGYQKVDVIHSGCVPAGSTLQKLFLNSRQPWSQETEAAGSCCAFWIMLLSSPAPGGGACPAIMLRHVELGLACTLTRCAGLIMMLRCRSQLPALCAGAHLDSTWQQCSCCMASSSALVKQLHSHKVTYSG